MASPIRNRMHSPEAGADLLCIQFAVGATGAVGAIQGSGKRNKEFRRTTPVVRTGVGVYDVFLREPWLALLFSHAETFGAVAATAGRVGKVTTNNVATATNPKVTVTFLRDDTGAAADPTNGDIASISLCLKSMRPD